MPQAKSGDDIHTSAFNKVDSPATDRAGTHQGMPSQEPQDKRSPSSEPHTAKDASIKASMDLPHERDQQTDLTKDRPNPRIEQARRDEVDGLKDTSRAAETDATYQKMKKS